MNAEPAPTFFSELIRRRYRHRQFTGIVLGAIIVAFHQTTQDLVLYGSIPIALGAIIRLWASGHVKKNKELATTGPYAFVRHPLYVGNHLIAIGICIASGTWWSWVAWLLQVLVFYPAAVIREDSRLSQSFGESWQAWRAETHALIPRLTPYRPAGSEGPAVAHEWSFKQSLMQNGEPIYVAIIAGAMVWLWYQG